MTYRGLAKGKLIELEEALPYPEGLPVSVSIEPLKRETDLGKPSRILRAMHAPPHLDPHDVDELERAIADARLPVRREGVFEAEGPR